MVARLFYGFLALLVLVMLGATVWAIFGTDLFADGRPWHYWIAPLLFLSAALVCVIALPLGYYRKVVRLKRGE